MFLFSPLGITIVILVSLLVEICYRDINWCLITVFFLFHAHQLEHIYVSAFVNYFPSKVTCYITSWHDTSFFSVMYFRLIYMKFLTPCTYLNLFHRLIWLKRITKEKRTSFCLKFMLGMYFFKSLYFHE